MSEAFTKDELRKIADRCDDDQPVLYRYLAEYSLAQTERAEKAEAEVERLAKELAEWKAKSDRHESERDSFRMTSDRLAKELAEAEDGIRALLSAYSPDGHSVPYDCFATGPLTGDPYVDLVVCPACSAHALPAVRRAREEADK